MKKILTLLLICFSIGAYAVVSPVAVSFKVLAIDTSGNAIDTAKGVWMTGSVNGWVFTKLEAVEGEAHVYQFDTLLMPHDTLVYYFILENVWDNYQIYREGSDTTCTPTWAKWKGDRWFIVPEKDTVINDSWGKCSITIIDTTDTTTTGIKKIGLKKNNIEVYPNPSNGIFNLNTSEKASLIEVFDITGKLVMEAKQTNQVNLSGYPSSMYILKVSQNNATTYKKIMLK